MQRNATHQERVTAGNVQPQQGAAAMFVEKHPWLTFFLLTSLISGIVTIATSGDDGTKATGQPA
jgi:hypothetical protein